MRERFMPPVTITQLPPSFLERFDAGDLRDRLMQMLRFIAPLRRLRTARALVAVRQRLTRSLDRSPPVCHIYRMRHLVLFALLCVVALSQSYAAEPASSATSTQTAATTAVAPSDSAKDTVAAKQTDLAARDKRLRSAGYKPKIQAGQTFYCRKEAVVGSRFEKEVCGTAESIDKATQNGKDMAADAQRRQNNPAGK